MGPRAVIEEVTASKLVGRGGAAFPTGRKWAAVAAQPATPHYLVCNADESEPGTFKDRVILEEDPFALIEAMTIAGFAVGASRGYLYLRGEYPLARRRLADAIDQARRGRPAGRQRRGLAAGRSTSSSGSAPAPTSRARRRRCSSRSRAAGRSRATSRRSRSRSGCSASRPRSTTSRRWSTCPLILRDGGAAYATIGTEALDRPEAVLRVGPRRAARRVRGRVRGDAARPPRARRRRAGRPARSRRSCSAAPRAPSSGPTSSTCRSRSRARAPPARRSGRAWSWCSTRPPTCADALRRIAAFFRDESCGQCVPCRVGTVRQEELLDAARRRPAARARSTTELALFDDLARAMRDASICGLGQTASSAIESAIRGGLVHFDARGVGMTDADIEPHLHRAAGPRRRGSPQAPPAPEVPAGRDHASTARPVAVPAGSTILEAARSVGIDTPTLCYLENLTPGQRVPRVRGRGDRVARARPRLLAAGRGRDGGPDRQRARPPLAAPRARAARARRSTSRSPARPSPTATSPATRREYGADAVAVRAARRRRPRPASATPASPGITTRRRRRRPRRRRRDRRPAGQGRQRPLRPRLLALHPLLQVRRGVRRGRPEHVRDRGRRARLRRPDLDRVRRRRSRSRRASTAATASASARPAR